MPSSPCIRRSAPCSGRALALALCVGLAAGCQAVLGIEDVTAIAPDGAVADGDTPLPPGPAAEDFAYRRPITIDAGGQGQPAGYAVRFVHDVRARLQEGKVNVNGYDWRIYHQVGDQMVEVPRWLDDSDGPFGTNPQTHTWFRVSEELVPNQSLTTYWVYYGYPELDTPPPDELDDVFLFGDDFEGDLSKWTLNERGETATVQDQIIWAGGQSLRIEPGTEQVNGGIHKDIDLPHQTLMFSHYLRQAQVGVSLGHLHAADKPWAERDVGTWKPPEGRAWAQLGSNNDLLVVIDPFGTQTAWASDFNADIWRQIEIVHDPVNNQIKARLDGGAFVGRFGDFNQNGQPVVNIAIEGEGQGGVFFLDNYIVRRYVEPEPNVNVGEEEAL